MNGDGEDCKDQREWNLSLDLLNKDQIPNHRLEVDLGSCWKKIDENVWVLVELNLNNLGRLERGDRERGRDKEDRQDTLSNL